MSRKDFQQLLDDVRRQGFDVRRGGTGHYIVTSPSGEVASLSATPSGGRGRALTNAKASLRRIGAAL